MSISKFEAAVFYDYKRGKEAEGTREYLIIDVDEYSYGYCRCQANGTFQLAASGKSTGQRIAPASVLKDTDHDLWNDCLFSIGNEGKTIGIVKTGIPTEKVLLSSDIEHMFYTDMDKVNGIIIQYLLSDRNVDGKIGNWEGVELSAHSLEQALRPVINKIKNLVSQAVGQIGEEAMENIRIIILGKGQEIALIDYEIRSCLSADPLLPDERFCNPGYKDPYSEIVPVGNRLYEEEEERKKDCRLVLFHGKTNGEEKKNNFQGPIFVVKGDQLTIERSGQIVKIPFPKEIEPEESDLLEVDFSNKDGKKQLLVRRFHDPLHTYEIPL